MIPSEKVGEVAGWEEARRGKQAGHCDGRRLQPVVTANQFPSLSSPAKGYLAANTRARPLVEKKKKKNASVGQLGPVMTPSGWKCDDNRPWTPRGGLHPVTGGKCTAAAGPGIPFRAPHCRIGGREYGAYDAAVQATKVAVEE